MRTLKKTLALVLVVAMMMSLCITSNAAFTDEDKISYETAVEVLSAIGVVEGYEDGSFKPTANVTRAEAAAMIVRAIGADVNAVVEEATFSDVPTTHWASKYVEYCAAAGIIDGRGNGTFDPSAKVTGYELGKMLLKVLGYTGNYTGSAWQIAVALDAADAGLYAGNTKADKTKAATREETCLYTLNALVDGTVTKGYPVMRTDADGFTRTIAYYGSAAEAARAVLALKAADTEGYTYTYSSDIEVYRENYMLKDVHGVICWDTYADIWGRPGVNYYDAKTGGYVIDIYDMDEMVAFYNVAVSDCDLAVDLAINSDRYVATVTNGTWGSTHIDVDSYALTNGAQGRIIEVYANRLVVIDTYLAQVAKVNDYKFDKNGHYISGGYSNLVVFDKAAGSACAMWDISYPAGSWILVQHNNLTDECYPVQVSDTMVGAQSIIWYNAEKHTIAGETYMDAVNFYLDEAQHNAKQQYTWFFDQFGNLIGAVKVQDVYTYAVISEIQWINPVGSAGYAQATLVYVDGTTESVIISSIDSKPLKYTAFEGNLATGAVSANYAYNYASYVGHALYQVATASNGVATLTTITDKLTSVNMDKGDPSVTGTEGVAYVDDNTQYLVGTNHPVTGWSWTTVTGYNQISDLDAATFYYVNLDRDMAAELVYVYGKAATSTTASLVYVNSLAYAVNAGDDAYITLKDAYVEGVLTDVVVNAEWINGTGTELVAGTMYYMVDVNGDGKIYARGSNPDTVVAIDTTPVTVGTNTAAVLLEAGSYVELANAIETLAGVDYNTVNYALYGAEDFTAANDIVVVYSTAYGYNYVVAIYVVG